MPSSTLESGTRRLASAGANLLAAIRQRPPMAIGAFIVLFFLFLALFGPWIAPYEATTFHMQARFQPPSREFLLGTDNFGRDMASRVIIGSRSIFLLAGSATLLALLCGTTIGGLSAYYGGLLDEIMMRVIDGLMAIPPLLMALLIISTFGTDMLDLVVGIAILYIPMVARVFRSAVLQEKVKEYVAAAELRGESTLYILSREILPNVWPTLVVEGSLRFTFAILLGASLGFLGLGVRPPSPDWGLMVNDGRAHMLIAPWVVAAPTAAICTLVIGMNLLADGVEDMFGQAARADRA